MNLKFSKRTLVLAAANLLLILILLTQFILMRPAAVRQLDLEEDIDQLVIQSPGKEPISLNKKGDIWFVGDKSYPADSQMVQSMVKKFSSLTVLDTVGGASDQKRYDLDEDLAVKLTLSSKGQLVRTLYIGKESSTGSQTFLQLDDSKDVLLVSSSFRQDLKDSIDGYRNKSIYSVKEEDVLAVQISGEESFKLEKDVETNDWNLIPSEELTLADEPPMQDEMASWVRSLLNMNASSYPLPEPQLKGDPLGKMVMETTETEISISVYEKRANDYLCLADDNPWPFTLSTWSVEKILKKASDFYPEENEE